MPLPVADYQGCSKPLNSKVLAWGAVPYKVLHAYYPEQPHTAIYGALLNGDFEDFP